MEDDLLQEAIIKKNEKIQELTNQLEAQKKGYEEKIKILNSSVNKLKTKADKVEEDQKNTIRISTINDLRKERKDQEMVIALLRKKIGDEQATDKYLLDEFNKKLGEQRIPLYEDMKIKIKQLEVEVYKLKQSSKANASNTNNELMKSTLSSGNVQHIAKDTKQSSKGFKINNFMKDTELREAFKKMKDQHDEEIKNYQEKISYYEAQVELLTDSNEKLEQMQSDLYKKIKSFNEEVGGMKSIYETLKNNLNEEHAKEVKALKLEMSFQSQDITKLREKIKEVIEISSKKENESKSKVESLETENEMLKKVLTGKKQELAILDEEIEKLKTLYEKVDSKDFTKSKKTEREQEDLKMKLRENADKAKFNEELIKKKNFEIEQLRSYNTELEEKCTEKDNEIDLLQTKLEELEELALNNYK